MNKTLIGTVCILAVTGCSTKSDANLQNMTVGMNTYLEKKGDLCLAKYTWPIDVSQHDIDTKGRNALQMPVLEKVGLVRLSIASVDLKESETDTLHKVDVKRYDLTDAGKKYYLTKEMRSQIADGSVQVHQGDFCAAKLSLDKVVGWKMLKTANDQQEAVVTYTYKIEAAPWTEDAAVRQVFPMVARIVGGAGVMELQESFHKTDEGWIAVNL
ncbi:hypothetical protein [Glaciimonas immobilis]|uniref:Lipoprotein n=1 Tax=Glaciimonas immobilis TaxID=728004 RepID=A0A840RQE6_9BURK|nr:hypothetical protein [Glaciimonas immobilis]KAF3999247.1 hypothetical protein HAV38_04740 [Glaciimonas immobilis]MBB5198709.1 hypothetical protein [Glaciimonas immobilis]